MNPSNDRRLYKSEPEETGIVRAMNRRREREFGLDNYEISYPMPTWQRHVMAVIGMVVVVLVLLLLLSFGVPANAQTPMKPVQYNSYTHACAVEMQECATFRSKSVYNSLGSCMESGEMIAKTFAITNDVVSEAHGHKSVTSLFEVVCISKDGETVSSDSFQIVDGVRGPLDPKYRKKPARAI
jgi:hypothetical protein